MHTVKVKISKIPYCFDQEFQICVLKENGYTPLSKDDADKLASVFISHPTIFQNIEIVDCSDSSIYLKNIDDKYSKPIIYDFENLFEDLNNDDKATLKGIDGILQGIDANHVV